MRFRSVTTAVLLSIVSVGLAIVQAAEPANASGTTQAGAGREETPTRLGAPLDQPYSAPASPFEPTVSQRCRRWRAAVHRLGETFAAFSLRSGLIRQNCTGRIGRVDEADVYHWQWPWSSLSGGLASPPRLQKRFQGWTIRCGNGPAKRRCALMQTGWISSGKMPDPAPRLRLRTHFVIDRVAGREMLLWRVHVSGPPHAKPGSIAYRLQDVLHRRGFTACGKSGCLVEVTGAAAGSVATYLAGGHALAIEVTGRPGPPAASTEVAAGEFGRALGELIRLRRVEQAARP